MNTELKPCPFCGGEARLAELTSDFRATDEYRIYCRNCGIGTKSYCEKEFVVMKWNTRVPSSEKPDNWIPVSEQLPDLGVLVLVTTSEGEVAENLLERPDTWFYDYGAIAWMPEPKAYRGGNKNDRS